MAHRMQIQMVKQVVFASFANDYDVQALDTVVPKFRDVRNH